MFPHYKIMIFYKVLYKFIAIYSINDIPNAC